MRGFSLATCFLLWTATGDAAVNFQPAQLASVDGFLDFELNVTMELTLNGTRLSPQYNGGPVGPTLRVRPGDTLRLTLNNNLDPSSARDLELLAYIQDPVNEQDNDANVTKIYNRLSDIGNMYEPEFGFWGFGLQNVHFHGAGFSPYIEDLQNPIDGGESSTHTFIVHDDHPPGLVWYHAHVHGNAEYQMMSGLFGAMIIEGTANDVTSIPEIGNATEIVMIMSEALINPDSGVPMPFFPIAMAFDWDSVTNGMLAQETRYEFLQGEVVLFRAVSASVEPTIRLYFNESEAPSFLIVSEDGFPVPDLETTDLVPLGGGARKEFMVKFDQPGTYHLRRLPWNVGITGVEVCNASFGIPLPNCISYDVDQPVATITVLEAAFANSAPLDMELPTEVPPYHSVYQDMEDQPVVGDTRRTIVMQHKNGFPIFQIPYDGPFVPPGAGFGMNDRLITPHYRHGEVVAGTCEEWDVIGDPPGFEHAFHIHTNPYLVTMEDGIPVDEPFWRDTYTIFGANITIKTCFNHLEPGDYVMVHCHQLTHLDIGLGAFYAVVGGSDGGYDSNTTEINVSFVNTTIDMFNDDMDEEIMETDGEGVDETIEGEDNTEGKNETETEDGVPQEVLVERNIPENEKGDAKESDQETTTASRAFVVSLGFAAAICHCLSYAW